MIRNKPLLRSILYYLIHEEPLAEQKIHSDRLLEILRENGSSVEKSTLQDHLYLLKEANLVEGDWDLLRGGFSIHRVTWKGHDYFDASQLP